MAANINSSVQKGKANFHLSTWLSRRRYVRALTFNERKEGRKKEAVKKSLVAVQALPRHVRFQITRTDFAFELPWLYSNPNIVLYSFKLRSSITFYVTHLTFPPPFFGGYANLALLLSCY